MRSDLFAVFVFADLDFTGRLQPLGEFDTFTGGGWSVDGKKYYPPGSNFPVNRGGKAEINDAEMDREWQRGRDDVLFRRVKDGPNMPFLITRHNRLPNMSIELKPFAIYNGLLSGNTPPDQDSQAADDAVLQIVVTPSGPIG